MFYGLGMQELLVILAIAMLLFGGKKLPEVGRNLGKAIRGFKEAEEETKKELQKASDEVNASDETKDDGDTEGLENSGKAEKEKGEEETEEKKGDGAT